MNNDKENGIHNIIHPAGRIVATVLLTVTAMAATAQDCETSGIALTNANILTMDADYGVADSVLIVDNEIREVGNGVNGDDECIEVIDLKGRTVIPGLIDSHTHFIRQANMPGNDTRAAEEATSIKSLQSILSARTSEVPEGEFISVMGGIVPMQLQPEGRFPNLRELDAAVPKHPVYIQIGFSGPAVTNSPGKAIFEQAGVKVGADGAIAQGKDAGMAFAAIKARQTKAAQLTSIKNLMALSNQLGMTSIHDQGGVVFPGAGFFDTGKDYDGIVELWRRGELTVRVRAYLGAADASDEPGNVEARLNNAWSDFGDGMFKMTAMGEHIVTFPRDGKVNPSYAGKVAEIAKRGWSHEQHSVSEAENLQHYAGIKQAHQQTPINGLRWSLSHVFEIGHPDSSIDLDELAAMGMGLKLQSQGYVIPTDRFPLGRSLSGDNSGPLYRTLFDHGNIPLGAGTDGILVVPMNPWHSIYYMVTGKNIIGTLVNPGQTLTRLEALRLYTTGSAWFGFDEHQLGSIEKGKLADMVVLSEDYLNIDEEQIKKLESVLTIVDGKIVYRKGL